jgi:hypothetical protein
MRILFRSIAIVLVGISLSATAFAQEGADEKESPEMRAKAVTDAESGAKVTRPDGWVSGKAGIGVIAMFRAAGDSRSQIEVRVSPHVKEKQGEFFFTSFHSNLQKAGFSKLREGQEATYGGKKGLETEYETSSKKQKLRLIVWQYQHNDSAYLVVGFFPAEARDKYYEDFQQVAKSLTFE